MMNIYKKLVAAVLFISAAQIISAQTLSDGPIQLQVRLRDVKVQYPSASYLDGVSLQVGNFNLPGSLAGDEFTFHYWAEDQGNISGLGWQGGACLQADLPMTGGGPEYSADFNTVLFNYTYPTPTVPQFFEIKEDCWEDDIPTDFAVISGITSCGTNGSRCTFQASSCCANIPFIGCLFSEEDDYQNAVSPYKNNLNYRLGPPCQWYTHGQSTGGYIKANNGARDYYYPKIESYWRYTKGDACNNAIDLGTLTNGGLPLTHFNSNECYGNSSTLSPGNDVWYKFHVNGTIGITASVCGVSGAQFDSYLYLFSACNQAVPDTSDDNGCGTQSVLSYSICQAGDYYIVVDGKTATDYGTFTISVSDNPGSVFGVNLTKQDVACFSGSDGQINSTIQGGVAPFTYAWSNNAGNVTSISGLTGGNYNVTVTDAHGCNASASVTINVPAQISVLATGNPVTCGGACDGSATANAAGGTTPYSYAWNSIPPQQLQNAVLLCAGNFNVTVTDFSGCTSSATANVPNTTTVIITLDSLKNVQCFGAANGGVYLSSTGGQSPLTFAWSNSVATQDNPNIGPGTYSITVTDNIGCTAGNTYTVTEPTLLTSNVSFTFNPRCPGGTDGIVDVNVNGGVQPYSYQWSAPTNATSQNLNNVAAGTHTVTITDANGCSVSSDTTLSQPTAYSIALTTTNLLCNGASNSTASIAVSGATAPYNYFWSDSTSSTNVAGLGEGTFSVRIKDANGCDTTVAGTITSPAAIQIALTGSSPLCADSANGAITTVVTGGTPGYSYSWTGTNNFTSTQQNPQAGAGTYTVLVRDTNNCTASETVGVNLPVPFVVTLLAVEPLCVDSSNGSVAVTVLSGGVSPFTYSWTGSNNFSSALQNPKAGAGNYTVLVSDSNGCTTTGSVSVNKPLPFVVKLVGIDPSCIGDSTGAVVASTEGGASPYVYLWNTSSLDTASFIEQRRKGSYSVTVTDVNGCVANAQSTLSDPSVDPTSCAPDKFVVLVPTAFSPNGDNVNDRLVAITRNVQKLEFRVFNRWGEMVYENLNMQTGDGWDGTIRGKEQPIGTYIFLYHVVYINGIVADEKGAATLIR